MVLEERADLRIRLRGTLKEYALNFALSFICYISYERTGNEQKWYNLPFKNQSPQQPFLGSQLVGHERNIAAGAGQS